jgi:hypothetical protein
MSIVCNADIDRKDEHRSMNECLVSMCVTFDRVRHLCFSCLREFETRRSIFENE